jgi:hypothetical protein
MQRRVFFVIVLVALATACITFLATAPVARAQTGNWWDGFDLQGMNGPVYALTSIPFGSNPEFDRFGLIAGGAFTWSGRGHLVSYLARWRGDWANPTLEEFQGWQALDPGGAWNGPVYALASWIVGDFAYVAIGGAFTPSDGQPYNHIALYRERYDGTAVWQSITQLPGPVTALALDNSGALVAGGYFESSGPSALHFVARWNGSVWESMDGGLPGPVMALCSMGDYVMAGGFFGFNSAAPNVYHVARWRDSVGWEALEGDLDGPVFALHTYQDENELYIGGAFQHVGLGSAEYIARSGGGPILPLLAAGAGPDGPVYALTDMGGAHSDLGQVAGGEFTHWGAAQVNGIAGWDPAAEGWVPVSGGVSDGITLTGVYALEAYTYIDPDPFLIAGGDFRTAGTVESDFIALWDPRLPAGSVPGASGEVVAALRLESCRPNPFNPQTTIVYSLDRPSAVEVAIHDALGRRVTRLDLGALGEGRHAFTWDGRDDGGRALPAGVYFARLAAGEGAVSQKLVIAR